MNEAPFQLGIADAVAAPHEQIRLLGQPHLADYISFVREKTVGGEDADPRVLADEWRAANDYYYDLEQHEAGIAGEVECLELDPALTLLAEKTKADTRFARAFDTLPTSFGLVELDRLVVCQQFVTRNFVEGLKARLGPAPDPERLFRFCQPLERKDPPVKVDRIEARRFMFTSDSTDFRAHDPALLSADQIEGLTSSGPVSAVVGLVVGFGSNYLQAIRADDRLILHNGYHRAYALRELGITHAPCVIQTVTRRDELNLIASSAVADAPEFYCKAARPPLLKDFFDPRIRKVLAVRRIKKMIEVKYEVREFQVIE